MINLLPPEIKTNISFARRNVTLAQLVVLTSLTLVAALGIVGFGVFIMNADQSALEKSIETKTQSLQSYIETEKKAQVLASDIDTAGKILAREVRFSEVLKLIGSILPDGASLRNLQLTNDDLPVKLTTFINDKALAPTLRNNIEESDLFDAADLESLTAIETGGTIIGYEAVIVARPASTNIQDIVDSTAGRTQQGGNQ